MELIFKFNLYLIQGFRRHKEDNEYMARGLLRNNSNNWKLNTTFRNNRVTFIMVIILLSLDNLWLND